MKELSLHLLDIAQNSLAAGARHVALGVEEADGEITLTVADDGRGMSPELLARVTDPFTTTRTTRKVGMGLPLLRLAAEQTGGTLAVESREGVGTTVTAVFHAGHIDCPPLGDLAATVALLAQGLSGETELTYMHKGPQGAFTFDTAQVRAILGPEVPLSLPEVAQWMEGYVAEGEAGLRPEAPPERGTRLDTVREGTT
ncbi:ATP-binding protein [uncultured Intestinimonas sp.]|uniref:ATP-binding protein n=1 Tax=uncultured Intestinimonas sp. TaxID=1689265 RepID=UPI0025E0977B|nr:ATP-binding protein [uncultured Intestinimonas sp.]